MHGKRTPTLGSGAPQTKQLPPAFNCQLRKQKICLCNSNAHIHNSRCATGSPPASTSARQQNTTHTSSGHFKNKKGVHENNHIDPGVYKKKTASLSPPALTKATEHISTTQGMHGTVLQQNKTRGSSSASTSARQQNTIHIPAVVTFKTKGVHENNHLDQVFTTLQLITRP